MYRWKLWWFCDLPLKICQYAYSYVWQSLTELIPSVFLQRGAQSLYVLVLSVLQLDVTACTVPCSYYWLAG